MSTASDIKTECLVLLGDSGQSYFSDAMMLTFLNRALKDICNRGQTLDQTQYTAKVAGQYQYPLPSDFLRVELVAYNDGEWYPLNPANLKGIWSERYREKTGRPRGYDVWGNARVARVTGTATGGGGTTLVDSGKNFTTGSTKCYVGDFVLNTTDDSEGIVTTVAATTLTMSDGLGGGSDNLFQVGDGYQVVSPHAPNKVLVLHPAPDASDVAGTESIALLYSAKHRAIVQADITNGNDGLEIDEELETALIHRVMFWARVEERGEDSKEALSQLQMYLSEYQRAMPAVRKRLREMKSTWFSGLGRYRFEITGFNRTTEYQGWV